VLTLQILTVVILSGIFIQDFKSRSVYWFWFPALVMLFMILKLQTQTISEVMNASLANWAFIIVQLLFVSIYFSIKNKQIINITNNLLGWGDVLFLLTAATYFSTLNYILFYILSLIAIVLIWIPALLLLKKKYEQIPLAGLQSLLFIVCLIADWLIPRIDLTRDEWLMHYLQ
jgi:hypothetical protein